MSSKANQSATKAAAKHMSSNKEIESSFSPRKGDVKKANASVDEESSSESELVVKVISQKSLAFDASGRHQKVSKKPESEESSNDSSESEEESSSEEQKPVNKKQLGGAKKLNTDVKKQSSSSDESDSGKETPLQRKKDVVNAKKRQQSSSEEESSSSSSSEESSSEDSTSEEEEISKPKIIAKGKNAPKAQESIDDILNEFTNGEGKKDQTLTKAQQKRLKKKENALPPQQGDGKNEEKKLSRAQIARQKKEKEAKEKAEKDKLIASTRAKPEGKAPSALALRIKKEREDAERIRRIEIETAAAEAKAEADRIAEVKRVADEKNARKIAKAEKRAADRIAGLLLTKTEKEKKRNAEQAVAAMKAAGMVVGPLTDGGEKKKRPVYDKRKKLPKRDDGKNNSSSPTLTSVEDKEVAKRKKEELQVKMDEISEEEPDWEALMASSDQGEVPERDSWDVDSEEEREQEALLKAEHIERKAARIESVTQLRTDFHQRKAERLARIEARKERAKQEKAAALEAQAASSDDSNKKNGKDLRSPICCILGHVDTGKTKLLDKIRHTNVQDMEAGGITQQIGATYFPSDTIRKQTAELQQYMNKEVDIKVPGLLVIDTPGHESFANLRSRGSGLCDIAILVVDVMVGLEKQTLESIDLLKRRKTPFVVALNKCDRMYGWKAIPNSPFKKSLLTQTQDAQQEFERRLKQIMLYFSEQGLNTCLWWENKDFKRNVSIIPTSAITGEGVPDLLMLLVQLCQKMMNERLMYLSELQCTVLEVKVVEGFGTTIDVILANGVLHEGDTIVICGLQGPIVTKVRALLTPPALRELRLKSDYVHNKSVKAAAGLKISAPNLEHAVPGSQLLVCGPRDDIERLKDEVMQDLATILSKVDKSGIGVCVQASTLGSLEALLSFLADSKIPVSGIAIGPVHKKDVMRASTMLERKREYAIILAFDVIVTSEAQQWALDLGVEIFTANIIYHLFDMCSKYMDDFRARSITEAAETIVFPCILEVMPNCVFRDRAPLVLGVRVVDGLLKMATPLCIPTKEMLMLGRVTSIQKNHGDVKDAKQGDEVCIKIEAPSHEQKIMFGRHFDYADKLVSKLTRGSIDLLKLHFKHELTEENWNLVGRLKRRLGIGLIQE